MKRVLFGILLVVSFTRTTQSTVVTNNNWNVFYNLPDANSNVPSPGEYDIRNALIERVKQLSNGNIASLTTYTFSGSATDFPGLLLTQINDALDRQATIQFIVDRNISTNTTYNGFSLHNLSKRVSNPLILVRDNSSNGIMHDKFGLFDYGSGNRWVFITSANFTAGACNYQWNIAIELKNDALYSIYQEEVNEFLAGRFHENPNKSHAHDNSPFIHPGSWMTNRARFSPALNTMVPNGQNMASDIVSLLNNAQYSIVLCLNKLTVQEVGGALIAAANRGVKIYASLPKSDTMGGASQFLYDFLNNPINYSTTNRVQFLDAYNNAAYTTADDGSITDLIHAKYAVIDAYTTNSIVIHGSANWTKAATASTNQNDENDVILFHDEIAKVFVKHFETVTANTNISISIAPPPLPLPPPPLFLDASQSGDFLNDGESDILLFGKKQMLLLNLSNEIVQGVASLSLTFNGKVLAANRIGFTNYIISKSGLNLVVNACGVGDGFESASYFESIPIKDLNGKVVASGDINDDNFMDFIVQKGKRLKIFFGPHYPTTSTVLNPFNGVTQKKLPGKIVGMYSMNGSNWHLVFQKKNIFSPYLIQSNLATFASEISIDGKSKLRGLIPSKDSKKGRGIYQKGKSVFLGNQIQPLFTTNRFRPVGPK